NNRCWDPQARPLRPIRARREKGRSGATACLRPRPDRLGRSSREPTRKPPKNREQDDETSIFPRKLTTSRNPTCNLRRHASRAMTAPPLREKPFSLPDGPLGERHWVIPLHASG